MDNLIYVQIIEIDMKNKRIKSLELRTFRDEKEQVDFVSAYQNNTGNTIVFKPVYVGERIKFV